MKTLLCILILSLCLILQGCGASHCITMGGKYEGVDGNVTYCYSPEKSAAEGKPVLKSSTGNTYLLTEQDLSDLAAIAATSPQPVKTSESATPCQQLCARLRVFRNQPPPPSPNK